jgi:hypothetical protein
LASKNPDSRLTMRFVGDPPRKCPIQRTSQKTAGEKKEGARSPISLDDRQHFGALIFKPA